MEIILGDFQKAIYRLKEVFDKKKTAITRDSAVKRFELCFDLAWKAVKTRAKNEGIECYSPKQCFKMAYQLGLIEEPELWLKILDDRNQTVHIYKEALAEEVYERVKHYLPAFEKLFQKLENSD
jgi:nucleotidyltransferase substrate binding protein (TIGR01987 family)